MKGMKGTKCKMLRFLSLALLAAGCSVGPEYRAPDVTVPMAWKNGPIEEAGADCCVEHWWEIFNDSQLSQLEEQALSNNRNLYIAWERIQEARALIGIAKANLYPQVNISPAYTNTEMLIETYSPPKSIFRAHEFYYFLPTLLSYEVDLWGAIKDGYVSAIYGWQAQINAYEAAMLSLTSNLATVYFQLRAADTQIDLLLGTLKARQKALEINTSRYEEHITYYASVTLAAEEVEQVSTQYYEMVRQRAVLENQMAVLIGMPASCFCFPYSPLEGLPAAVPSGIPSDVMLRRPDIAEAERRMRSQNALVKRAYAQFFPSLTLTVAGGFESPILKDFLRWIGRYWQLGASGNQMVFDGYLTESQLKRQIAIFKEMCGEYQQRALIAFEEVESALSSIEYYAKQFDSTASAVQWSQKTYQLFLDRYISGLTTYINVVDAERDLLAAQMALNSLRGYRYTTTIQLIKALGGGWD